MRHALRCIKGGLAIARHQKICDKLLYLAWRSFASASVRAKSLINKGHTRSKWEIRQGSYNDKETRVDVMIQGLWYRQDDSIIDVKGGNADAESYKYEPMAALLDLWETIKKYKHGKHCHYQRKPFSLFVLSINGILWREYLVVLFQLIWIMETKMDELNSHVQKWINSWIGISVVRSYSCMIHRDQFPSPFRDRDPEWDP